MNTNQNAVAVKIVDDINARVEAGMVVTAQLGNPDDMDWVPKAPLLLLHTNTVFFGKEQFTGLYKDPDDTLHIARFVQQFSEDRQKCYTKGDVANGIMYCTSSLPWNAEDNACEYMGEEENKTLRAAFRWHRAAIETLPTVQRYVGLQLVK